MLLLLQLVTFLSTVDSFHNHFHKQLLKTVIVNPDVPIVLKKNSSQFHSPPTFSKTNRQDGQLKWMKELYQLRDHYSNNKSSDSSLSSISSYSQQIGPSNPINTTYPPSPTPSIDTVIEIAKELLYSGIPDQVLELYASYFDLIINNNNNNSENSKSNLSTSSTNNDNDRNLPPVVPDSKLILVTTRAFIELNDVFSAIKLLQSCSRANLDFDLEVKSLLMADLAESSSQGLQAALKLRKSMLERHEKITAKGYTGLLKGIRLHGMKSKNSLSTSTTSSGSINQQQSNTDGDYYSNNNNNNNINFINIQLLVDPLTQDFDLEIERSPSISNFRLSPWQAEELAETIFLEYEAGRIKNITSSNSSKNNDSLLSNTIHGNDAVVNTTISSQAVTSTETRLVNNNNNNAASNSSSHILKKSVRSMRLVYERLRIAFRVAAKQTKVVYDTNFDINIEKTRNRQVAEGLKAALLIMKKYQLQWSIEIINTLLEECLNIGNVDGVVFLVSKMKQYKLYTETYTFNTILKAYVDSGDSESAYTLVKNVMSTSQLTQPNTETWELLLRVCIQTFKGRYYAKLILAELQEKHNLYTNNNANNNNNTSNNNMAANQQYNSNGAIFNSHNNNTEFTKFTKPMYDVQIQLNIFQNQSFYPTIYSMISNGYTPDETTVLSIITTCEKMNKIDVLLQLYSLLSKADVERRLQRQRIHTSLNPLHEISNIQKLLLLSSPLSLSSSLSSSTSEPSIKTSTTNNNSNNANTEQIKVVNSNDNDPDNQSTSMTSAMMNAVSLSLPPPTKRIIHVLLKLFRDRCEYKQAIVLLADMNKRVENYLASTTAATSAVVTAVNNGNSNSINNSSISSPSPSVTKSQTQSELELLTSGLQSTAKNTVVNNKSNINSKITSNNNNHSSNNIITPAATTINTQITPQSATSTSFSSSHASEILLDQLRPNIETYALVIEACVDANQSDLALDILNVMEKANIQQQQQPQQASYTRSSNIGSITTTASSSSSSSSTSTASTTVTASVSVPVSSLSPDRRIYSAMIQAFGIRNDIPSALGVFTEMKTKFTPDVQSLQSILKVCMKNPVNIRQACLLLQELDNEGYDLDVYSNDIIMQSFPDAVVLGKTLEKMIVTVKNLVQHNPQVEIVTASFTVLSALVQALRTKIGVSEIIQIMEYLSTLGITIDSDTMAYFRLSDTPILNSINSRHYNRQLLPQKQKRRELFRDIQPPVELQSDLSLLPVDRVTRNQLKRNMSLVDQEPYFDSSSGGGSSSSSIGGDNTLSSSVTAVTGSGSEWTGHVSALKQAMLEKADENGNFEVEENDDDDDEEDGDDDEDSSGRETLLFELMNDNGEDDDGGEYNDSILLMDDSRYTVNNNNNKKTKSETAIVPKNKDADYLSLLTTTTTFPPVVTASVMTTKQKPTTLKQQQQQQQQQPVITKKTEVKQSIVTSNAIVADSVILNDIDNTNDDYDINAYTSTMKSLFSDQQRPKQTTVKDIWTPTKSKSTNPISAAATVVLSKSNKSTSSTNNNSVDNIRKIAAAASKVSRNIEKNNQSALTPPPIVNEQSQKKK